MTSLTLSVCPLVWGWKTVDIRGWIPDTVRKSLQLLDVNLESRSDTMSRGRPWRRQILRANIRSRSSAVFLFYSSGVMWAIFENWSITTHNSLQSFDRGRSVMKSMAIDYHVAYGSSRGERRPYLLWRRDLSLWQSGQT